MRSYVSALACCALAALACAGCGRLPGKPTPADVPLEPRQVHDFARLYKENCAGCHGLEGKGNGALALANPVYLAIVSDDTLRRVTAGGVPGTLMPPFAQSAGGDLVDEQVQVLVHGIRGWAKPDALQGLTPPPYTATATGDAQRGSETFAIACTSCHGADGKGMSTTGSIVDGSFLALVSDQNLRTTVIAGRPDLGHPDWRHYMPGRALTDSEVTDVVAWLASHRLLTPGQPYPASQTKP
jgi:cytochrome c oxidase cbb3-type subunit III